MLYGYTFICSLLDTKPGQASASASIDSTTFKSSSFYNSILLTNDYLQWYNFIFRLVSGFNIDYSSLLCKHVT